MIGLPRAVRPLVTAVGHLFTLWLRTIRVRVLLPDGTTVPPLAYDRRNLIFAMTERDLLAIAAVSRRRPFATLIAEGNDGDWVAALAAPLGCRAVRGSSLRGGTAAMLELVRILTESDTPAVLAVDGPVGPAGVAKPGVLVCAERTQRAIVPIAAAATHAIVFRSWASHYLPLPFSGVVIATGSPVRDTSTATLDQELHRLRAVALSEVNA